MDFLSPLWLPILLSGVGVWIASAIAWMAIGHHKKDRDAIPGGGEQDTALGGGGHGSIVRAGRGGARRAGPVRADRAVTGRR